MRINACYIRKRFYVVSRITGHRTTKTTMSSPFSDFSPRFYRLPAACGLVLTLVAVPAQAQETTTTTNPPATTEAPAKQAAQQTDAAVDIAKRLDPTDFKNRFDVRSEYTQYNTATQLAIVPRVDYAISKTLSVRAEIPIARYDPNSAAAAEGIGNLQTRLAWRAARGEGYAMVVGSELVLDTASDPLLTSGKNVVAPFAFWAIDVPSIKSVFFPYLQYGFSAGGDSRREDVTFTNMRTSLLTRWPDRMYSFVEVSYWFDHERSHRYSSTVKAELGRFISPKTGLYLRPGTGMSGTNERLGMKWSMEVGMRHFF